MSPKIARKYLIFRVTTSKKQPHTRARPPPHWMGTPSPFPLNCCKYAAGPPGRVPDALEEVPRVSGWLRSSPRTPPRVPRWCRWWWCPADILKRCPRCWWWSAGAHRCQNRRPGCRGGAGHRWPVVVCAADILKRCPRCWWWSAGAHRCQNAAQGAEVVPVIGGRWWCALIYIIR